MHQQVVGYLQGYWNEIFSLRRRGAELTTHGTLVSMELI